MISGAGIATLPVLAYSTVKLVVVVRVALPGMFSFMSSFAGVLGSVLKRSWQREARGAALDLHVERRLRAPARLKVAVICVNESIVTLLALIVVAPLASLTVVPGSKPPPVSVIVIVLSMP